MKHNLMIFLIFIILMFFAETKYELFTTLFKRGKNNKLYKVQDFKKSDKAADIIGILDDKIEKFVNYLYKKYPDDERIQRLKKNMKNTNFQESIFNDNTSAYTINKGEIISMCVRHKNENKKFHDIHTLMFVVIHELAHVISISLGHNEEFMRNFRFLLKEAKIAGLHNPVDYSLQNMVYCGVKVTHNPYFDNIN